jgi:hypothetical protein
LLAVKPDCIGWKQKILLRRVFLDDRFYWGLSGEPFFVHQYAGCFKDIVLYVAMFDVEAEFVCPQEILPVFIVSDRISKVYIRPQLDSPAHRLG